MFRRVGSTFLRSMVVTATFITASVTTGILGEIEAGTVETPEQEERVSIYITNDVVPESDKEAQGEQGNDEHQEQQERVQEKSENEQQIQQDQEKAETEEQTQQDQGNEEERTKEEIISDPNSRLKDLVPYLEGTYEENLELLAHIIHAESEGSSDLEQQLVGTVVVYRAFTSAYGARADYEDIGNLESVIFAPNQYAQSIENGRFSETPAEECYRNAEAVLKGETLDDTPRNVLYQSTFEQGTGVYMRLNNTFCYADVEY